MGLSLADAAVRGNTSTQTIAEQKQSLLSAGDTEGLIALNHSLFGSATMMAKGKDNADDDAEDDDDDDEDDSDDGEDDDSDDDEDEDDKGDDPRDVRIQELSAEAKKKRLRIRAQAQEIADLKAENARLKGSKGKKGKDEDDEDDSESDEAKTLKQENESLKETLRKQTLRTEFNDLLNSPKSKIKFKDPKVAFRLLDLDDVEVDEDGEVDGLEDAIKDLAKEAPYLLVGKADKDEDDEDEPPRRRKTGQRTGGSRSKGKPNRDALISKYNIKR